MLAAAGAQCLDILIHWNLQNCFILSFPPLINWDNFRTSSLPHLLLGTLCYSSFRKINKTLCFSLISFPRKELVLYHPTKVNKWTAVFLQKFFFLMNQWIQTYFEIAFICSSFPFETEWSQFTSSESWLYYGGCHPQLLWDPGWQGVVSLQVHHRSICLCPC